jgi:magnesium-transporting ATPase (P-type)
MRQVGPAPHATAATDLADALTVDPAHGLSAAEAAVRLAAQGPNELEAAEPPSILRALVDSVREPFVLMLIGAGLLAVALG